MKKDRDCDICGENNYKKLYQPKKSQGPVVKCEKCQFVYINPLNESREIIVTSDDTKHAHIDRTELQNLIFNGSRSKIAEYRKCFSSTRIEQYMMEECSKSKNALIALDRLVGFVSNTGNLLEIGSFCGIFLNQAQKHGWNVTGVEPIYDAAFKALDKYNLRNIHVGVLGDCDIEKGDFDVVVSFQVFEHLLHPSSEIKKIHSYLKEGGACMLEVPVFDCLSIKYFGKRHRHFVHDHISFFSKKTLSKMLTDNGFEIMATFYPGRNVSIGHIGWWVGRYSSLLGKAIRLLPKIIRDIGIYVPIRDVMTIVAKKI